MRLEITVFAEEEEIIEGSPYALMEAVRDLAENLTYPVPDCIECGVVQAVDPN